MLQHLRANLCLLLLTVLLCSVLYPLLLLAVGQTVFRHQAEGSLLRDARGSPVGSRLIAQPFPGDQYFQPRPSAVSYNAAAAGASNWGANNPLLRDRVARQLGPLVKYRDGRPAGPEVEKWFARKTAEQPGWLAEWAASHSAVAANWAKSDDLLKASVLQWAEDHPEVTAEWRKTHADPEERPKAEDLAVPFLASYAKAHPGTWPAVVEQAAPDGKREKKVQPVKEGADVQAAFFDAWLQEHPDADLQPVPADLVMSSGSGLDPHITLENALYQLDRVAEAWAKETKRDRGPLRQEIEGLLNQRAEAPLGGLAGVKLVNVLEVNLALCQRYEAAAAAGR